jgi:hypothetical protein
MREAASCSIGVLGTFDTESPYFAFIPFMASSQ